MLKTAHALSKARTEQPVSPPCSLVPAVLEGFTKIAGEELQPEVLVGCGSCMHQDGNVNKMDRLV